MTLNYSTATEQSSGVSMADWLAILQKNSKSEAQLQSEMLEGVSDLIKDIQDKALEKAKESMNETDSDESTNTQDTSTVTQDDIVDPSEVTAEDLQSPVDLKL